MLRALRNIVRLVVIARTLARYDALTPLYDLMQGAGLAFTTIVTARWLGVRPSGDVRGLRPGQRLALAFTQLGPAFIKLGQMLSTRSDLLGEQMAADLAMLRDRLAPFPAAAARATIEAELGQPVETLFASFEDEPISAASIAQVHYGVTTPSTPPPGLQANPNPEGAADVPGGTAVAIKVLRPGIEQAFVRDLDLMHWLADLVERTQPRLRRLKPVAVVQTFAETVRLEMDLRMEAAAASELAANFAGDPTYRVPAIDWRRTARRVMTQERLIGVAMDDRAGLAAAGHDVDAVLERAAAILFNQVFRDGYFHGDQHPGNIFVDENGNICAVDFGIMGRLDRETRYYLADMLLAFLQRDYRRVAEVNFEAGYVPATQSLPNFAQACRSIGEPIFGRPLNEISFARVLGQLFQIGEAFDMEVQPQLLLLQKNMLMAEGVSRQLNPALNVWVLSQPLIERWMRENRGPEARLRGGMDAVADSLARLPSLVAHADTVVKGIADEGFKLHPRSARESRADVGNVVRPWQLAVVVLLLVLLILLT